MSPCRLQACPPAPAQVGILDAVQACTAFFLPKATKLLSPQVPLPKSCQSSLQRALPPSLLKFHGSEIFQRSCLE